MKYLLILILVAFTLSSCDPDRLIGWGDDREDLRDRDRDEEDDYDRSRINLDELPEVILDFIEDNYSDNEIVKATFKDGFYIVYLDDGTVLYFTRGGRFADEYDGDKDDRDRGDDKDEDRDGDESEGNDGEREEDDERGDDILE